MSTHDTLVLAWHGSRNPAGKEFIAGITARVQDLLPGVAVHTAWVDIEPVLLAETLAGLGDCTLVPCFLSAGHHVTHDVAEAVASAPGRVRRTPHLGGVLHRALCDRVAEAGGAGDAVVLAAAGSAYAPARAEVAAVAARLSGALGVPVTVGNIYQSEPRITDAVHAAASAGEATDVLVLPYTLAPGLWGERIAGLGARVAQPLGDHPDVPAAIAGRFLGAPGRDQRLLLSIES